jgi:RES domain-containing protein
LREQLKKIPSWPVTGMFWHQGATSRGLKSRADPPLNDGRYHRKGHTATWYASTSEQGAWAEMFRHLDRAVSPFEIRRRVGRVEVISLRVLDLARPRVQDTLGVTEDQLVDDDLTICQSLGEAAVGLFEGVLGPSAALPGCRTLAVFPDGMAKVWIFNERVRQPPPRMADLIDDIRIHREMKPAALGILRALRDEGADAVRRQRRRESAVVIDLRDPGSRVP